MHVDGYLVLGSAIVGFLVGLTGAGGGALMTPMLIFVFGVSPTAAISSDLVAAVLMRPVGAAVHLRRRTVNLALVGWLAIGSVPGAFAGAYLLHVMGDGKSAQTEIEVILGSALLLGAAAMVLRAFLRRRSGQPTEDSVTVRPAPTVAIGLLGGVMVGLTSVGSGSLMIVLLLFAYPAFASSRLVGTDLVQAIPLTAAAALGQLIFGHVEFGLTTSIVIGSVPAVLAGSLLSSRAPDRLVRPVITAVIVLSGLKYVGVGTDGLAAAVAVLGTVLLGLAVAGWRRGRSAPGVPAVEGAPGELDGVAPGTGAPVSAARRADEAVPA